MFLDDDELVDAGVDFEGPDFHRKVELCHAMTPLDVLVDIHTTSQPSAPFAIGHTAHPEARRLSRALPVTLVDGLHQFIRGTACQWLLERGKAAITVEVGSHLEPAGPDRAFRVAHRVLAELDMLPEGSFPELAGSPTTAARRIVVQHHVQTVGQGFRYARHFENFDPLAPGEVVGEDEDQAYRAPMIDNPVIFMPAAEATLQDGSNTDAFFFGVEVATGNSDTQIPLPQTA
jgi:succinylglutamate desuccinylase